ncbi:hypothetical protein ACJ6WF_46830 [Streptomyces sp. MMS24-I2-30]|uniref:hypothetical protein n=1 Tax=Streptomyces sp. MMS24-I2-30 TaxID=3351564 RepID=UPI003896D85C
MRTAAARTARPHAVVCRPRPGSRPSRTDRKASRGQERTTGIATVEQTRRVFEAVAGMAAELQDGIRDRAGTHRPRPRPTPATAPPPDGLHPARTG